jgi:hypothetical protein
MDGALKGSFNPEAEKGPEETSGGKTKRFCFSMDVLCQGFPLM